MKNLRVYHESMQDLPLRAAFSRAATRPESISLALCSRLQKSGRLTLQWVWNSVDACGKSCDGDGDDLKELHFEWSIVVFEDNWIVDLDWSCLAYCFDAVVDDEN